MPHLRSLTEKVVETLTAAILDLVELYCNTFNADFQTAVHGNRKHHLSQEACLLTCPLSFTVYATHRIPITWAARYEGLAACPRWAVTVDWGRSLPWCLAPCLE